VFPSVQDLTQSVFQADGEDEKYVSEIFYSEKLNLVVDKLFSLVQDLSQSYVSVMLSSVGITKKMFDLSQLGKVVKNIHPFNTIECFLQEENIEKIRYIFDERLEGLIVKEIRKNFFHVSFENLKKRGEKNDLLPHLEIFSGKIGFKAEIIEKSIFDDHWQELFNVFFQSRLTTFR